MPRSFSKKMAIPKSMMTSTELLVFPVNRFGSNAVPKGVGPDLEVVSIETNNPANTLKEFGTSDHPWAVKFRQYAKKAYGIDFSIPSPLNENLIDWNQPSD